MVGLWLGRQRSVAWLERLLETKRGMTPNHRTASFSTLGAVGLLVRACIDLRSVLCLMLRNRGEDTLRRGSRSATLRQSPPWQVAEATPMRAPREGECNLTSRRAAASIW